MKVYIHTECKHLNVNTYHAMPVKCTLMTAETDSQVPCQRKALNMQG